MPTLLICANSYSPQLGGIATYASQLALQLTKLDFSITVLAPYFPGQESIDLNQPYDILRYTSKIDLMKKWFSQIYRTDLVFIVQRGNYLSLAYFTNKFIKRPYVIALHGLEGQSRKLPNTIKKMNSASAIIPVSNYTANYFKELGIDPRITRIINNGTEAITNSGLDIRRYYDLGDSLIILTVARLIRHKGQDHLLKALPNILKEVPNAHYLIVGDGPDRESLENLAFCHLGLKGHVTFTGAISHEKVAACYYACDIFAMISRQHMNNVEGFGIAFLEAGYAGKAVVGGDSGGIPDAIEHNRTGVLVDPQNLNGISLAIIDLLTDKNKRIRYGTNGKNRVLTDFTWDKVAARYSALFKDIINK